MNVHAVKRGAIDVAGQVKLNIGGAELSIDNALGFTTVTYSGSNALSYVFSSDMSAEALVDLVTNTDLLNVLTRRPRR